MKKIFVVITAIFTLLSADYEVFKSQTADIGEPVSVEEIYFGEYTGFAKKLKQSAKTGFAYAVMGGLAHGTAGFGIHGVIGLVDPFVMSLYADQKYLSVVKMTDASGRVAFKKVLFVGDKNPKYSEAEIRQLIK